MQTTELNAWHLRQRISRWSKKIFQSKQMGFRLKILTGHQELLKNQQPTMTTRWPTTIEDTSQVKATKWCFQTGCFNERTMNCITSANSFHKFNSCQLWLVPGFTFCFGSYERYWRIFNAILNDNSFNSQCNFLFKKAQVFPAECRDLNVWPQIVALGSRATTFQRVSQRL